MYGLDRETESSNILISKTRVVPSQAGRLTIPKLELTSVGLLVGCHLLNHLNSLFLVCSFYLWSDSIVALDQSEKELNGVYVANRVAEIQVLYVALGIQLLHVQITDNPADLLSRGSSIEKLKSSNWLYGPKWLITKEYPNQDTNTVAVNKLVVEINPVAPIPPILNLSRFSKFTKALRVMSRILKFLKLEQKFHCNFIYSYLTNSRLPFQ